MSKKKIVILYVKIATILISFSFCLLKKIPFSQTPFSLKSQVVPSIFFFLLLQFFLATQLVVGYRFERFIELILLGHSVKYLTNDFHTAIYENKNDVI